MSRTIHDPAVRLAVDAITREMANKGRLIEGGWRAYELTVLPKDAGPVQRAETRTAYFAGAQHLYASIMGSALDPGTAETDGDVRRMELIHNELGAFASDLELRVTKAGGRA